MGNIALNNDEKSQLINDLSKEIVQIKAKLDSMKELYAKLDERTEALNELLVGDQKISDVEVFVDINETFLFDGNLVQIKPQYLKVVDNFSHRNIAFRTVAVRRLEAVTETVTERAAKNLK